MSTTFLTRRATHCECGSPLDACTDVAEHGVAPEPGDMTICVYCGCVFQFDNGKIARKASPEAVAEFRALEEYPDLVKAVLEYRKENNINISLRYSLYRDV